MTDQIQTVQPVDNSAISSVEAVIPESSMLGSQEQTQTFEPGSRDPGLLQALLSGADPNQIIKPKDVVQQPQQASQQVVFEPQAQIPDKFKNPDGTPNIEAMAKSYVELEKAYGEQGNKLGQLNQVIAEMQQLKGIIHQLQQGVQAPAQAQQPPGQPVQEPEPEELTPEMREKMLEEYYEDPIAFMDKRLGQTLEKIIPKILQPITPIVQAHEYNNQVASFQQQVAEFTKDGQNPDFFELVPVMQEIIDKNPWVEKVPNPVETLYRIAKGTLPPSPPPPSLEQILQDPNIRQKIISDPAIVAEIRKGYIQEVAQGVPPVTIANQQGGVPVSAPSEKPRSAREAGSLLMRMFNRTGT